MIIQCKQLVDTAQSDIVPNDAAMDLKNATRTGDSQRYNCTEDSYSYMRTRDSDSYVGTESAISSSTAKLAQGSVIGSKDVLQDSWT